MQLLMERQLPLTDALIAQYRINLQVLMRHHARLKRVRQVNTRLQAQRQQLLTDALIVHRVHTHLQVLIHLALQAIAQQVQLPIKLQLQAIQIVQSV